MTTATQTTSNVIPLDRVVDERYSEKRFASITNMICFNVNLWTKENQATASSGGRLVEFWVKNGVRQCKVEEYQPHNHDYQLFPLIAAFDLLGSNRDSLELVCRTDAPILDQLETPPGDPNMKVRWIVMETCRLIMVRSAQERARQRYPQTAIQLPPPELMQ